MHKGSRSLPKKSRNSSRLLLNCMIQSKLSLRSLLLWWTRESTSDSSSRTHKANCRILHPVASLIQDWSKIMVRKKTKALKRPLTSIWLLLRQLKVASSQLTSMWRRTSQASLRSSFSNSHSHSATSTLIGQVPSKCQHPANTPIRLQNSTWRSVSPTEETKMVEKRWSLRSRPSRTNVRRRLSHSIRSYISCDYTSHSK